MPIRALARRITHIGGGKLTFRGQVTGDSIQIGDAAWWQWLSAPRASAQSRTTVGDPG
jgi:hypothetical protein